MKALRLVGSMALVMLAALLLIPAQGAVEAGDAGQRARPTRVPRATATPVPTAGPTPQVSPTPAPATTTPPPPSGGSFFRVDSPNQPGRHNRLHGIAALSETERWAVGESTALNGTDARTLTMRWSGAGWQLVDSPNPDSARNILLDVDAAPGAPIWAVGVSGGATGPNEQTLVLRWDGVGWTHVASPNPGTGNRLRSIDILGPDDAWAVGDYSGAATNGWGQPLVLRWDGAAWTHVPAPQLGTEAKLNAVSAIAPNDVWAVGTLYANARYTSLILHWDGVRWSQVDAPHVGSTTYGNYLYGVAALSPSEVWAVGAWDAGRSTLALRWNGVSWAHVSTPNGAASDVDRHILQKVERGAAGELWAVGRSYWSGLCGGSDAAAYRSRVLIERWDGAAWAFVPGEDPSGPGGCTGQRNELEDVVSIGGETITAGHWYDSDLSQQIFKTLIEQRARQ